MQAGDRTYIFLTAQRKAWHHDMDDTWKEEAFERFSYVECAVMSKPTADLNDDDKSMVESYGEPNEDFRMPAEFAIAMKVFSETKS